MFAAFPDVQNAYEGDLPETAESRVQYLLDVASARLRRLIPDLEERMASEAAAGDASLTMLARDVIVQAVIRRYGASSTSDYVQQSQSAGPFSMTVNTGTRANRGMFYEEELNLLRPVQTGQRVGTINLRRPDWCRPS